MSGEVYCGWETDMPEVLAQACPVCGGEGIEFIPGAPPDMRYLLCEACGGRGIIGRAIVVEDHRPIVGDDVPF